MEEAEKAVSAAHIIDVLRNPPYRAIPRLADAVYLALQDGQLTSNEYDRYLYNPEVYEVVREGWTSLRERRERRSESRVS